MTVLHLAERPSEFASPGSRRTDLGDDIELLKAFSAITNPVDRRWVIEVARMLARPAD